MLMSVGEAASLHARVMQITFYKGIEQAPPSLRGQGTLPSRTNPVSTAGCLTHPPARPQNTRHHCRRRELERKI
ncbi:hypothetical protein E2C01_084189 [Portunus trituberculatus]|uniref:Uncharacterized protein n=1 Tax=Portunus trituberculatus TaxID=210409 RepID=A0A5B7IZA1_PORTR|nr:hypothetical protein [Portunus trituberculatus]